MIEGVSFPIDLNAACGILFLQANALGIYFLQANTNNDILKNKNLGKVKKKVYHFLTNCL